MARVNIEEKIFKDQRFYDLLIALGDRFKALGALVALWSLAQEYWKKDRSLIPKAKWHEQKFPKELITCGFVEERETGFYVKGSEKHFAWLVSKVKNGQKGGRPNKNNDLDKSYRLANESYGNPPTPTPTLSLTLNKNNIAKGVKTPSRPAKKINHSKTAQTWDAYKNAYEIRYGHEPVRNARINGQLSQIVKRIGEQDAPHVAEFYVGCNDDWLVKNIHPIGILLKDCETYHTRWKAGIVSINHNQKSKAQMISNNNARLWAKIEQEESDDQN